MGLTIGVDVGGTKVLAGVVDEDGQILAQSRRPTPSTSATDDADVDRGAVSELRQGHDIEAVGIGAAGWIDETRSTGALRPQPRLARGAARDIVEARIGLPVIVENDANAAAWGEHRFGAGRGQGHLILITVGTGIGCGIILTASSTAAGSAWAASPATSGSCPTAGAAAAATAAAGSSTQRSCPRARGARDRQRVRRDGRRSARRARR